MAENDADFAKGCGFAVNVPGMVLINGAPREGKSHLMEYIMYHKRHRIMAAYVFSNTMQDPSNLPFVSPDFKFPSWNEEVARGIINFQKSRPKEEREIIAVLIDDCMANPQQWSSQALLEMCTQMFHLHLFVIIAVQHVNKVPTTLRESYFQTAIFRTNTENTLNAAYASYGQDFNSQAAFKQVAQGDLGCNRFAYKNKFGTRQSTLFPQLPCGWEIYKAPAHIPAFTIQVPPIFLHDAVDIREDGLNSALEQRGENAIGHLLIQQKGDPEAHDKTAFTTRQGGKRGSGQARKRRASDKSDTGYPAKPYLETPEPQVTRFISRLLDL